MQCEVLTHKEEQSISKELHESGHQVVVTCKFVASKDLGSPCSGDVSHGEVAIKETNGGCCGQKEYDLLSMFMEACGLEVEGELSTMATQYWAEGVWTGKWRH